MDNTAPRLHDTPAGGRDLHRVQRYERMQDTQAQAQAQEAAKLLVATTSQAEKYREERVENNEQRGDSVSRASSQPGMVSPTSASRRQMQPLTRAGALEELDRRRVPFPQYNTSSMIHDGENRGGQSLRRRSEQEGEMNYGKIYKSRQDTLDNSNGEHHFIHQEQAREAEYQSSIRGYVYDNQKTKKQDRRSSSDCEIEGEAASLTKVADDPMQRRRSPIQRYSQRNHGGDDDGHNHVTTPHRIGRDRSKEGTVSSKNPTPRRERSVSPTHTPSSFSSRHPDRYSLVGATPPHSLIIDEGQGLQQGRGGGVGMDVSSSPAAVLHERGNLGECRGCHQLSVEVRTLKEALRTVQDQVAQLVRHQQLHQLDHTHTQGPTSLQEFTESDRLLSMSGRKPLGSNAKMHPGNVVTTEFSQGEDAHHLRAHLQEQYKAKQLKREARELGNSMMSDGQGGEEEDNDSMSTEEREGETGSSPRDAALRLEMQAFEKRLLKATVQLANRVNTLEEDSLRLTADSDLLKKDQTALFESTVLKSEVKQRVLQILETSKRSSDDQITNLYDLFHFDLNTVQSAVSSQSSQQCLDVVLNSPGFKELFDMGLRSAREVAGIREHLELGAINAQAMSNTLGPVQQLLGLDLREENNLQLGLKVRSVMIGSPSQVAGIVPGDRINRVNNTPIMTLRDFVAVMSSVLPNTNVKLQRIPAGRNQFPDVVEVIAMSHNYATMGTTTPTALGVPGRTPSPFSAGRQGPDPTALGAQWLV